MSGQSREEYLKLMQDRYRQASRKGRSLLLDEMEQVTGRHRKHLIELMGRPDLGRRARARERGVTYGPEVKYALSVIAESLDYICAERLKDNLGWMAEHLASYGHLDLTDSLAQKLERISVCTIRRLLAGMEKDEYYLPRPRPRRPQPLTQAIPMKRLAWNETEPGHLEVDLVFHSGSDPAGEFAHSLHLVDAATGWSEIAAILGRSQLVVADGFQRLLARLPFPVVELHPDNGGEFFNDHLLRLFAHWVPQLQWSRSRPYQKNDNRFVEQKNFSLVRAYLGYQRLDTVEQVRAMNRLYEMLSLYYNLFQPVLRLRQKELIPLPDGTYRTRRRYGPASTPFERLRQLKGISPEKEQYLLHLRQNTDPRMLRSQIHELAAAILRLPGAAKSAKAQNVHLTLYANDTEPPLPVGLSSDRMTPAR